LADVFKDTNFGYRLAEKGLETDRYDAWLSSVDQMFEYPWGGRFMKLPDGLRYVHNIWLDQLYNTGIIPMILLMAFHILQIPIFFDFLKLNLPRTLNLFFISIIIALLAAFVQAPVLQASFPFFASSCFFFGSIMKLTIDSRVLRYSM
jgi:O-antigen ligase